MNLTEATSVTINGKEVKKIQLNGQIVYELINIQLTTNKQHIITGETVNINLTSNVINKEVELFKVIGLTKTKIETLTTDENGQASYTYTGTGAGNVSFVAVYDNKESNTVRIDDYVPAVTTIELGTDKSAIISGQSVLLTATVKDQHGELMPSGTVTFKENGVSIGTGIVTSGVTTLTVSNFNEGTHSIIAEIGNVTSNTVNVNVLGVTLSFGVTGSSFSTYSDTPFVYTGNVFVDWGDSTTEEYIGGALTHTYSVSDDYTVKIYGNIIELTTQCFGECDITDADIGSPITTLENMCFGHCTSLSTVLLSDSVTSIEPYCFAYGTALTEIVLEWDTASSIVTYDSSWIASCSSFDHFLIPEGTTALYEAKSYPSALLVEQTSFDGIDLDSDKSILSAADHEYATLTAQLTFEDEPVAIEGETVTFEVRKQSDDSLVETLTADTNSSGVATVSYLGKGTGDLYIKCFSIDRMIFSEIYGLEDCWKYDDATSDNTSSYDTTYNTGQSFSYNSSNSTYKLQRSSNGFGTVLVKDLTVPNNVELSYDVMGSGQSSYNIQPRLCLFNENNDGIGFTWANIESGNFNLNNLTVSGDVSANFSENYNKAPLNSWYHIRLVFENGNVTVELSQNGTVLKTKTSTTDKFLLNTNKVGVQLAYTKNAICYFKNIKIKPL